MSTNYIYGTVLTSEAVAANNRGDNIGNTTTLQKVFHNDDVHTSVSAEAIRFALRYRFQLERLHVNRSYDSSTGALSYIDEKRTQWADNSSPFVDDDLMGFMDAAAPREEREESDADEAEETLIETKESGKSKTKAKPKGKTTKRQSPLAIGRAVSLRPYRGELSFNCVSGTKEKGKLSLYNAEMHTTEYQYSFGLNLDDVVEKKNIGYLLDAIVDPPAVGGNHSRFAYDFCPSTIVLRVTNEHSSRIQNLFEHEEVNRSFTADRLIQRIKAGDISATEIIVGGGLSETNEGKELREIGVAVFPGVKAAMNDARERISKLSPAMACVAQKVGAKG
jgi:CRISPR-associated protein Cst2